jgi:hypothetical protein
LTYRDPFGLDTLRFEGGPGSAADRAFDDCRADRVCNALYDGVDALAADMPVRMAQPGEALPAGKQDAYTRLDAPTVTIPGVGGVPIQYKVVTGGQIILQPETFGQTAGREGTPITLLSVAGHELGHIHGTAQTGPGLFCGERCAFLFEAAVRQSGGLPPRPYRPELHGR